MRNGKRRKRTQKQEDLTDVLGTVKNGAAGLLARAKSGARTARAQVARKASEAAAALGDEATRVLENQKERATDRLGGIAQAGHQTARAMRAARMDAAGSYVEKASETIDDLTDYLEAGDVGRFVKDAAELARRHPVAAAACTLAVGVLVGRFIAAGRKLDAENRANPVAANPALNRKPRRGLGRRDASNGRHSGDGESRPGRSRGSE
jgi:vacuolar-type H+-ATPase subunit H